MQPGLDKIFPSRAELLLLKTLGSLEGWMECRYRMWVRDLLGSMFNRWKWRRFVDEVGACDSASALSSRRNESVVS